MSKLKLTDIATALEISPATVSKALKGYSDVNADTRKRILDYTQQVGFKPQYKASSLRTGKSGTIGVILPSLQNLYFLEVLEALVEAANKVDLLIIPLSSHESIEQEQQHIHTLSHYGVDAIFLSLTQETADISHLEQIQNSQVPVFLFDKISKQLNRPKFFVDDRKAAYEATRHLIDQGCRRIAHFRVSLLAQTSIDRFLGYREALDASELPYDKNLVFVSNRGTQTEGTEFVQELLNQKMSFDGIFAINDELAIGAMKALKTADISIPNEVAVVGFSNSILSKTVSPQLTTVDQGPVQIAESMIDAFLKYPSSAEGDPKIENLTIIPTALVIRESSRRN